jgi:hypothetical protein
MINERIQVSKTDAIPALRWLVSIVFFFLAMIKSQSIINAGLVPYREFLLVIGWPLVLQYYGVVAMLVEFYAAISLWSERLFLSGIVFMSLLTTLGVTLSIYSLIFKLNSECGCGLLGQNEYGLLIQKFLILIILSVLYRNKYRLFPEQ